MRVQKALMFHQYTANLYGLLLKYAIVSSNVWRILFST